MEVKQIEEEIKKTPVTVGQKDEFKAFTRLNFEASRAPVSAERDVIVICPTPSQAKQLEPSPENSWISNDIQAATLIVLAMAMYVETELVHLHGISVRFSPILLALLGITQFLPVKQEE